MALHRTRQADAKRRCRELHRKVTRECLNEHLLPNLSAARRIIEAWRIYHSTMRPHTSLDGLTPIALPDAPVSGRPALIVPRASAHVPPGGAQLRDAPTLRPSAFALAVARDSD